MKTREEMAQYILEHDGYSIYECMDKEVADRTLDLFRFSEFQQSFCV